MKAFSKMVVAFREKSWFEFSCGWHTDYALYQQTCAAYGQPFEFIEEVPKGRSIVIVDEKGDIPLEEFEHPEDAVYVFGRTGMDLKLLYPEYPSVRIDTPYSSPLFGCVACGIILEDRKRKMNGRKCN
ncbi:hypothetical protein DRN93_01465 [archaeon]|nr:MAG: hypothetical protein DRN93_01465 [archaeon]